MYKYILKHETNLENFHSRFILEQAQLLFLQNLKEEFELKQKLLPIISKLISTSEIDINSKEYKTNFLKILKDLKSDDKKALLIDLILEDEFLNKKTSINVDNVINNSMDVCYLLKSNIQNPRIVELLNLEIINKEIFLYDRMITEEVFIKDRLLKNYKNSLEGILEKIDFDNFSITHEDLSGFLYSIEQEEKHHLEDNDIVEDNDRSM